MYKNLMTSILLVTFALVFSACSATKAPSTSRMYQPQNLCEKYHFLRNYQCSFDQVRQAAYSGDPYAQYVLGYLYYYGIGVASNDKLALKWITEAANKGNTPAQKALALLQPNQPSIATTSICKDFQGYTIQIVGSHDLAKLRQFVRTNQSDFAENTFIFHKTLNGASWYILAYGQYSTYKEAQRQLYRLPGALKIYQPWVKSCASFKQ